MLSSRWCGTGLLFSELSTYFAFRHVKHVVNSEEFFRDTMCRKVIRKPKRNCDAATEERRTGLRGVSRAIRIVRSKSTCRLRHRRHPRLVHRQQRHRRPQYPNHVSHHRLSSHESLSGSAANPSDSWRAIRPHIRPGPSTSPANPATTGTMPKHRNVGR